MKRIILTAMAGAVMASAAYANPYETEFSTPTEGFEFSHTVTGSNTAQAGDDVVSLVRVYEDGNGNTWHGQSHIYYKLDYISVYMQSTIAASLESQSEYWITKIAQAAGLTVPNDDLPVAQQFLQLRDTIVNLKISHNNLTQTVDTLTAEIADHVELAAFNQNAINDLNAEVIDLRFRLKIEQFNVTQLTAQRTALNAEIADLEADIELLNATVALHQTNNINLASINGGLTAHIAVLNSEIAELQALTVDAWADTAVAAIESANSGIIIDLTQKSPLAEEYRVNGENTTQQPIDGRTNATSYANQNGNEFLDVMQYNLTMNGVTVRTGTIDVLVWNNPHASAVNVLNELGATYRDAYETGWSDGYEEGYDDGYDDGYDEGFIDGYVTGWNDATESAKNAVPGS